MAKFSNDTLVQVAGFDGKIVAQELVYSERDFWNFIWTTTDANAEVVPVNLSNCTITSQIIRREITDLRDTRSGISFNIHDYPIIPKITDVTSSNSSTNWFTCESTSGLFADQPVEFTGTVFGNVSINTTYYVKDIPTATNFTISDTSGGSVRALTDASGNMVINRVSPDPVNLTISNRDDANGTFTMTIDQSTWDVIAGDPELDINANSPYCYSGRVKVSFPVNGTQPAYDETLFLLFLVRSDGVIN